jgi:hypothetical protein
MYLPSERMVVNGVGLGELDGMFNIGKMFTRMFTFTPSSFKLKNIAGTIGSAVTTIGTGGIANIASEVLGSSGLKVVKGGFTSSHSKPMQYVGYGTMAAAAAAGAYYGGSALLSKSGVASGAGTTAGALPVGTGTVLAASTGTTGGTLLSTIGSSISNIGSGLTTVMKALPVIGQIMGAAGGGGGGGGMTEQQQQGGMTQAEFDAQQRAAYEAGIRQQQQEEAYRQQVQAQQAQMMPVMYSGGMEQPTMQTSYGDLRSPYTAITEDGQQVQVDPLTGQVIPQETMSTDTMIGIGGIALVVLAGWYFMSDSKKVGE